MSEVKTVNEIIEEVAGQICDHYCKWPEHENYVKKHDYQNEDELYQKLMEEKCEHCPLNRLI